MATGTVQREQVVASGRSETLLAYLVPARMVVGYHFILVAWQKIAEGFPGDALARQLLRAAPRNPIALHRDFIVGFVVPHVDFFSFLITWGELAIGISFVLGCLVRVSAAFAAFENLNLYLAIAIPGAGLTRVGAAQVPWNRTLIFMDLVFLAVSAGRSFGIDGFLKRRFPRNPLF